MSKVRLKGSPGTRITKTDIAFGFRTTIPKEIRKTYSVKEGMQIIWYDKNGEIRIFFRKPIRSIKDRKETINSKIPIYYYPDKVENKCPIRITNISQPTQKLQK